MCTAGVELAIEFPLFRHAAGGRGLRGAASDAGGNRQEKERGA